jgi:hypothetical protein
MKIVSLIIFDNSTADCIQEKVNCNSFQYEYVYSKANMQVTDSGAYGALAIYSDYGSSALVTVNTNVLSKCRSSSVLNCKFQ